MIAYHASHEQFAPSELLHLSILAERAGFDAIHSSEHFHPWSERQGQSGFSFAWLGGAMHATTLPFGVICAPGPRYHPAIIAQAVATLLEMYPGRLWLSLGSGEALNEHIIGTEWKTKSARNEMLLESVSIIRRLFAGEKVTHNGLITVRDATLYTRPAIQPMILGAALTPQTAALHGSWADGLLTVAYEPEQLAPILQAFRDNGGAGKPVYLKFQLSYARRTEDALEGAFHQWRNNVLPTHALDSLRTVADFDAAGESITRDDLKKTLLISNDPDVFIERIEQYRHMGCEHILLHNVNRLQAQFIHDFQNSVLPKLDR
jgi:probable non-F420 flavinoid oxidoreductase